ncbi:MAG: MopE-related protein [Pseudomonadota bacterium]
MRALLPFIALALAACEEPKQDDTGPVVAENTPPTASFVSPAEGAALRVGDPLSLTALVGDAETAVEDLVVTWTSSRDGVLAGTASVAAGVASLALATELSAGDQTLSVIVADEEGLSASDQVTISVQDNAAPSVSFTTPEPEAVFAEGADVTVSVSVSDDHDDPSDITLAWGGDAAELGAPTGLTASGTATFLIQDIAAGSWLLSVTATDSDGADASEQVLFTVIADADQDGDGYPDAAAGGDDCDDTNPAVHPDADEVCDGIDNDCDGTRDQDALDATRWYTDADADGYGDAGDSALACTQPAGTSEVGTDCDDTLASVNPGAGELCDGLDNDCDGLSDEGTPADAPTWYRDADSDGYGDSATTTAACAAPSGYVADDTDCDDRDAASFPGADELCDGDDNDCDGTVDEASAIDASTWYRDADADGYGLTTVTMVACTAPSGYAAADGDCDDGDAATHPGAAEACDGVDNDCDGTIDDGASGTTRYYTDADGDTWGDASSYVDACAAPAGTVTNGADCDDTNTAVNPGATEFCDGMDNDCDGSIDEYSSYDASTWYYDGDGDGFGATTPTARACTQPTGYVATATDCDDADATVHPGATETCDGVDQDCDGSVDEGATDLGTFYADADGDGFGDASSSTTSCTAPTGYVTDTTDCDDTDATVFPGAGERCDGIDNDCDGYTDEGATDATTWYLDLDGDGYGGSTTTDACDPPTSYVAQGGDCNDASTAQYPGAPEICDGYDNDCDGDVDEELPTWYRDADGDGYGNPSVSTSSCTAPSSYVADDSDCDDGDPGVSPDGTEVCFDGVDNDCDGTVDGTDAVDTLTWYADADADGYGDASSTTQACTVPSGYVADDTDCDDSDALVNPDAQEICDGVDNDCDGAIEDAILVPGDYSTITAAIAAAVDGDTICLGEGDYTGPVDFDGKDIIIEGAGSDLTNIDVNGGRVTFDAGETADAQLIGVTLWGGNQDYGAALLCSNASPTLDDVVFDSNTCTSFSQCKGMAYFSNCNASLTDVVFSNNSASISASVYGGAMYVYNSDLTVDGLTLEDNSATGSSVQGGLVYMVNSDGTWDDVVATGNTAYGSTVNGGAFYLNSSASPSFSHLYLADNAVSGSSSSSYSYGGLFYLYNSSSPTFEWTEILDNTVNTRMTYGGLFYLRYSCRPYLYNTIIAGNTVVGVRDIYGGIFAADTYTSTSSSYSYPTLYWADITGNDFSTTSGGTYIYGGIFWVNTYGSSSSTTRSSYSGGVKGYMVNVVSNTCTGSSGTYGTVLYNTNSSYTSSNVAFTYDNFYGNGSTEFYNYTSPVGSSGNIALDPLYVDVSAASSVYWDLTLQSTSPVRNAGNPSSSYFDTDGTYSAIGAYGGPLGDGW